jgi:glycosyltransferase involved in cell wall biosynthesis
MKAKSATKVSVCIPVRNGEKFLQSAVQSVFDQSFDDFELIIIDNASTDGTAVLAEELAAKYDKVHFFKNDCNLGLVGNFNACLKQANGEYIKYLCADDLLLPSCLDRMVLSLEEDASVMLVVGGRQFINEAGNAIAVHQYSKTKSKIAGFEVINRCLFGTNYIGEPSAVMFRREAAQRGFREEFAHLMDIEMWFHLLEKGAMVNLPESLCAIRRHAAQMTAQSIKTATLVEDNVRLFEEYGIKTYIHQSWVKEIGRRIRMAYRVWLCRDYLEAARKSQVLKSHSIPLVYHLGMPVLAGLLSRVRHTHLLKR